MTEEGTCVSEAQHNDVYEAFTYGTECVQKNEINQEMEGSEDCLYINVWTPRIDHEAKLDVMLYVHGGHLMTGSGHQPGKKGLTSLFWKTNKQTNKQTNKHNCQI